MRLAEWDDIPNLPTPIGSYQGPQTAIYKADESPIVYKKRLGKYALKNSRNFRLDFGKLTRATTFNRDEDLIGRDKAELMPSKSTEIKFIPEVGSVELDISNTSIMSGRPMRDPSGGTPNLASLLGRGNLKTMTRILTPQTPKAETPSPTSNLTNRVDSNRVDSNRIDTQSSTSKSEISPANKPLIIPLSDQHKKDFETNNQVPSVKSGELNESISNINQPTSMNKVPVLPMILPVPTPLENLETTNNTQIHPTSRFLGPKKCSH